MGNKDAKPFTGDIVAVYIYDQAHDKRTVVKTSRRIRAIYDPKLGQRHSRYVDYYVHSKWYRRWAARLNHWIGNN